MSSLHSQLGLSHHSTRLHSMACLRRLAGKDPVLLRSGSVHWALGWPDWCFQYWPSEWLDAKPTCVGAPWVSRAMQPNAGKHPSSSEFHNRWKVRADTSALVICWVPCLWKFGIGTSYNNNNNNMECLQRFSSRESNVHISTAYVVGCQMLCTWFSLLLLQIWIVSQTRDGSESLHPAAVEAPMHWVDQRWEEE